MSCNQKFTTTMFVGTRGKEIIWLDGHTQRLHNFPAAEDRQMSCSKYLTFVGERTRLCCGKGCPQALQRSPLYCWQLLLHERGSTGSVQQRKVQMLWLAHGGYKLLYFEFLVLGWQGTESSLQITHNQAIAPSTQ